jgi:hypothetical protein
LAGLGFFVKELNVGWDEWKNAGLPTHSGRVARGELRCSCSDELSVGEPATL